MFRRGAGTMAVSRSTLRLRGPGPAKVISGTSDTTRLKPRPPVRAARALAGTMIKVPKSNRVSDYDNDNDNDNDNDCTRV
ncbi:hypothetical protein [uncultured Lamprocystis sp.]|jgi:hypothetical protein|uniref:hypothetical protein n=1 Tax=uncultured Lamprocystis sp. TaxID=543132 RepID=UPI0025FC9CE4|nr:hypothetical protein [uncultured Lamprocystis sp.]